jgi:hypothetical protein
VVEHEAAKNDGPMVFARIGIMRAICRRRGGWCSWIGNHSRIEGTSRQPPKFSAAFALLRCVERNRPQRRTTEAGTGALSADGVSD